MAGMFYTIQEVAAKLGKSEDQIRQLVKDGKLREFRDGAKILFKTNEVDGIAGPVSSSFSDESTISLTSLDDSSSLMPTGPGGSTSMIPIDLGDEAFDLGKADAQLSGQGLSGHGGEDASDMTNGDTMLSGEGLSVLGETDTEYKITDDKMGKTQASSTSEPSLEKIEEDVNLDSFGSGSGLLDFSLQADDTSLGGVLDEIYPGADAPAGGVASGTAAPMDVAAEAEQMITETAAVSSEQMTGGGYIEPEPDAMSNMTGLMLIVPLIAVIYTIIVAMAAKLDMVPVILSKVQDIIWYVMIGAAIVSLIILAMGFVFGSKPKANKTA